MTVSMGWTIRPEREEDYSASESVNAAAFEREDEATLVRSLRGKPGTISLVAVSDSGVCGHVLFSPVQIFGEAQAPVGTGLGPVAVSPERQREGIGLSLVQAGLDECRRRGIPYAVVLGHADYYPKFGFVPASRFGLRCRWPVPDEVFMALELTPGALEGVAGLVEYDPEFSR